MNDHTIPVIVGVLSVGYVGFCLLKRWIFIRDHKVCPHCGHEMRVLWVGEEVDARKEKVSFGGKRMIAGKATRYTSLLRCSHCGHEISL